MPDLKDMKFASLTQQQKIEKLAEGYAEDNGAEMREMTSKFELIAKTMRDIGMGRAKVWATVIVAAAEQLEMDLDSSGDLVALAIMAEYQLGPA